MEGSRSTDVKLPCGHTYRITKTAQVMDIGRLTRAALLHAYCSLTACVADCLWQAWGLTHRPCRARCKIMCAHKPADRLAEQLVCMHIVPRSDRHHDRRRIRPKHTVSKTRDGALAGFIQVGQARCRARSRWRVTAQRDTSRQSRTRESPAHNSPVDGRLGGNHCQWNQ